MSSHPGSTLRDAVALAEYLNARHRQPEQVLGLLSGAWLPPTCMYYTGIDPRTMERSMWPRNPAKTASAGLAPVENPENWRLVKEALVKRAGRISSALRPDASSAPIHPSREEADGSAKTERRKNRGRPTENAPKEKADPKRDGRITKRLERVGSSLSKISSYLLSAAWRESGHTSCRGDTVRTWRCGRCTRLDRAVPAGDRSRWTPPAAGRLAAVFHLGRVLAPSVRPRHC